MKLKLARIVLKQPQNGTETRITHRGVEVSHFYSICQFHLLKCYIVTLVLYNLLL